MPGRVANTLNLAFCRQQTQPSGKGLPDGGVVVQNLCQAQCIALVPSGDEPKSMHAAQRQLSVRYTLSTTQTEDAPDAGQVRQHA